MEIHGIDTQVHTHNIQHLDAATRSIASHIDLINPDGRANTPGFIRDFGLQNLRRPRAEIDVSDRALDEPLKRKVVQVGRQNPQPDDGQENE
jgi:hypothetical protein